MAIIAGSPALSLAASILTFAAALFAATKTSPIPFVHQNSPTKEKYLIETMGGGVALLDYNNDGRLDIFLVNSGNLHDPMPPHSLSFARSTPTYWNRLYKQEANGAFTDVTASAGLSQARDGNYGMGAAAADFDNDGFTDLYVTNYGRNTLYRNNGDGTFSDGTERAGVAGEGWSVSAGFFDYDNDGLLDLFVTRYMEWSFETSKVCARNTYCPPGNFPQVTNLLFHNLGGGRFENVSGSSGIAAHPGRALGVAFNDYDADGFTDIFVANDGMSQYLFHNNGHGMFEERALDAGVAFSDNGTPISGMGVDFRDYDNDGKPDIIVTDLPRQAYAVFHNDDGGSFTYRSRESRITSLTAGSSGWGVRWEDLDNDGWKDLLIAQGHVMDNVEQLDPTLHYREQPLLAWNRDGRFARAAMPVSATPIAGRGVAFGDLNNDGWTDAVIGSLGGSPAIWFNGGGSAHWLTLRLKGTGSNRDGAGAKLIIGDQTQYASASGSYASASDKSVHFGLRSAQTVTVEVFWPSGKHQRLENIKADRVLQVIEP